MTFASSLAQHMVPTPPPRQCVAWKSSGLRIQEARNLKWDGDRPGEHTPREVPPKEVV